MCNHSNLKTPSQCVSTYNSIQHKPDKALQACNNIYESYYKLAHPCFDINDDASMVSCTHYASLLHGKLGGEMKGRFNQQLPDNLKAAFQKDVSFMPRILTKQWINTRSVSEVNHIDVSNCDDYQEFEVNEVHIRNPNYKAKNYDPITSKTKTSITIIIPAVHLGLVTTSPTTTATAMEGNSTATRATTQRSQPMFK